MGNTADPYGIDVAPTINSDNSLLANSKSTAKTRRSDSNTPRGSAPSRHLGFRMPSEPEDAGQVQPRQISVVESESARSGVL